MEQQVVIRSREQQLAEARYGQPLDVLLATWYHDEGLTLDQIGKRLGITKGAVSRWMERFGVVARRGGPKPVEALP